MKRFLNVALALAIFAIPLGFASCKNSSDSDDGPSYSATSADDVLGTWTGLRGRDEWYCVIVSKESGTYKTQFCRGHDNDEQTSISSAQSQTKSDATVTPGNPTVVEFKGEDDGSTTGFLILRNASEAEYHKRERGNLKVVLKKKAE